MRDARAAKFDVVVAEALDRISRDQEDLAGIHKRLRFCKIEIRTVQDGKAEEIHVGIKGLLGALYLKDLAQKTKRGQAGVIRDGRHNGGRSFGYRPLPGQPGRLEILPDEAAIVRRIFASYVAGQSPRDIAGALNREGIPAPRGGHWNASTIGGVGRGRTVFCKTNSTSATPFGIGRVSSKIQRMAGVSVGLICNPIGWRAKRQNCAS
jgi:site-specific DNA recombinase